MTAIPPPSDPPFGADTDEAVSALLDGELGAFAVDRGTTELDARARLEAWPGLDDRRAALVAARAAVATPSPPLDDVTRRRVVRNAVDARPAPATEPRRSRRWTVVGAAAAALVVIVGIGFAINATSSDDDSMSSGSASSDAGVAASLHGNIGDVGDLSRPDALRALLSGRRAEKTAPEGADSAGGATNDQSGSGPPVSPQQSARSLAPPLSPDECAAQLAGPRPVTFTGTGTYRGVAVTVIGLTERGRVIAFLVPSNDCTNVLASVSR